jgi:hypothetical protein
MNNRLIPRPGWQVFEIGCSMWGMDGVLKGGRTDGLWKHPSLTYKGWAG